MKFYNSNFSFLRIWYKTNSSWKFVIYCIIFWFLIMYISDHSEIQHIGFISATYYKNSSLYPPNTVVILFNSQKRWNPEKHLVCESWSSPSNPSNSKSSRIQNSTIKDLAHVRHAFLPNLVCKWATYIAICKVSPNLNTLTLSDTRMKSIPVSVPIRKAYETKHDVISCFSPLFYNERWQLIIPTLEIYRQYGVGLQVFYIQSIRKEIYNFLQVYKNANLVEIEPWIMINLGPGHANLKDPNSELEWRNQAGAHTDCFLKYREAAEFIIVADIDDILFPRIGKNYFQEFQALSLQYPFAAGFTYNRYNTEVVASKSPSDFSLFKLIDSARITNEWEDGKSVIRPSRVQTAWIHWPSIYESGYQIVTVPENRNYMVHLRNWTLIDFNSTKKLHLKEISLHNQQMSDIIRPDKVKLLEQNSKIFISNFAKIQFESLPTNIFYYPLIEECYNRIFYSKLKKVDTCPGPLSCDLPNFVANVSCVIAHRNFSHQYISKSLQVHFPLFRDGFELNPNGCQMQSS